MQVNNNLEGIPWKLVCPQHERKDLIQQYQKLRIKIPIILKFSLYLYMLHSLKAHWNVINNTQKYFLCRIKICQAKLLANIWQFSGNFNWMNIVTLVRVTSNAKCMFLSTFQLWPAVKCICFPVVSQNAPSIDVTFL